MLTTRPHTPPFIFALSYIVSDPVRSLCISLKSQVNPLRGKIPEDLLSTKASLRYNACEYTLGLNGCSEAQLIDKDWFNRRERLVILSLVTLSLCLFVYFLYLDSKKAAFSEREHDLPKATFRPVKKSSVKPFVSMIRVRGAHKGPMLMPPASFILPARGRETSRKSSLSDGTVVRASNSSHPASTPHTSPDSQNQMQFSPSSEASSSSRSLEEDEGREDNSSIEYCKEEEENGEMVDMEEVLGNTEGEGKEKGGDISAGEQVDEGRESKEAREKTVGNQLFEQQREQGNLQERIAAMKNTLQEFQELKTAYK